MMGRAKVLLHQYTLHQNQASLTVPLCRPSLTSRAAVTTASLADMSMQSAPARV